MTGCAASSPPNVATYVPAGEGGFGALLDGTVYQVHPCIAVEDDFGVKYVPVFAVGSVDVQGGKIFYRGTALTEGTHVSLGGGFVGNSGEGLAIPDGCEGDFWIVNQE
jgi:hypothetical protein